MLSSVHGRKEQVFSECANPDCLAEFDYRQRRFFRFPKSHPEGEIPANTHSVQHLWLCEKCSLEYTLEYKEGVGVLIRLHLQDLPGTLTDHLIATR